VIEALRARLEPAFVPRRVVQVPALPREATGKLTAAALRRLALQTLGLSGKDTAAAAASAPPDDIVFDIAADHPAFAGHFPGHPVLPGAALLSLVLQAVEQAPALRGRLGSQPCIDNAKFLAPVGPGAKLQVALREHGTGVAFDVRLGDTTVARGQFSAAGAA
jgi:acyl dehydratase